MTSQLLLLLGKSWKTFYRSRGWLVTQCVVTLLLFAIVSVAMYYLGDELTPDEEAMRNGMGPREHDSMDDEMKPNDRDMRPTRPRIDGVNKQYKCLNAANDQVEADQCRDDIKHSIRAIYDKEYKHPCREGKTYNISDRYSKNKDYLMIRTLDETAVDIDYIAYSYFTRDCSRQAIEYASDQYNKDDQSWPNCDVAPNFHFIAQYSGKMNVLVDTKSLKRTVVSRMLEEPRLKMLIMFANIVALFLFCLEAAVEVTQESSNLIKDYLLSMGMSRLFYFMHHFIFNFLKATTKGRKTIPPSPHFPHSLVNSTGERAWIAVILFTAVTGAMLKSMSLFLFLFITFSLALGPFISISLAVGSCFKKPGTTVVVTIIIWLFMLATLIFLDMNRMSSLSILCSANPLFAVSLAYDSTRENHFRGMSIWFAEVKYAIPEGYYMLMLVFDTIFYFFLAVFIDWLATSCENPFTLVMQLVKRNKDQAAEASRKSLKENQEKSDDQNPAELIIEGLHKVYSTGQHVVRGIDLRLHKGQVTALLGHNGAGKSTTFSMISGMIVPTKGRIEVRGSESVADRQKLIGFCPQYNPIFPKLTVDEHLDFFARLKGFDSGTETGNRVLTILGMGDKGGERAINLSGGMKRKLCMAISMAADPPIVLLDEPTAGLDPGARRDFEKMLLEWKKDHAILLTTHYTDEAELLADRIFIMAKGKIFCSGSAQYLRKKFDSGYVLSFAVQNESDVERASTELMKIVQEFVSNVSIYKSRGKQFEFKLIADDSKRFVEMFRKIEEAGASIGMQSYGLSLNKLEQVFLKVGEMTGTVDRTAEVQTALKELIQENDNRVQGPAKVMKQFGNILQKRLLFDIAHIKSLILILTFIFVSFFFVMRKTVEEAAVEDLDRADALFLSDHYRIGIDSSLKDDPKIKESVKHFGDYLTLAHTTNNISDWYNSESLNRPPILGVLSRIGNEWTIYTRGMANLPILEGIAARVNNPSLGTLRYGVKQVLEEMPDFRDFENEAESPKEKKPEPPSRFSIYLNPLLVFLLPFMIIRPMAFLILERVSNFAHQERLTGVNRVVFLFSSIFYDFLLFLLPLLTILAACSAGSPRETAKHLPEVIYLPLLAFLSGELLILLFYRIFASRAKGEVLMIVLLLLTGLMTNIINQNKLPLVRGKVEYNWFPFFLLNPMLAANMWKNSGSKSGPFFIITHFVLLIGTFLLVEFKRVCKRNKTEPTDQMAVPQSEPPNTVSKKGSPGQNGDPSGVAVQSPGNDYVLRVNKLQKWYGGKNNRFHAVKGISFGVRSHECFGVLGINGAGKSSTFEVLTGNALPDGGSASVGGVDCSAAPQIGYCPQADALMEDLTGRQSLIILAALHGYESPRRVADIVITCVGMEEHANKKSKRYSGGQRRKISVAASLLAQNSLIILDEPTAGIDPIARRDIWSVICALREQTNTAIVLTSHSMDEVEALVSNLIIMRAGSIVVEGSPQMIKNQYGDHYSFNLTIENGPKVGEITSHVLSVFPTASLYDSASLRNIKYRIPRHNGDVFSSIFEEAAAIAEKLNATDFCFTQATLEDAFMLAATSSPQKEAAPDAPREKPVITPGTVSSPDPARVSNSQPETASVPEPVQKTAKDETVSATQSADH